MNVDEYQRMYELEGSYWWFQGRLDIIKSVLSAYLPKPPRPGHVLDVGCGTGLMLEEFRRWRPLGLDYSPHALAYSHERGIKRLCRGDVTRLPLATGSMDLIFAFDVMEHIDRHDLMIREFRRVLAPGGCLMATVPAHPSLWSDHDVALHHYRRYTRASLRKLLRHGGFQPVKFSYAVSATYPGVVAFRKLQNLRKSLNGGAKREAKAHLVMLPKPVNAALKGVLSVEAALLRHMDLPFGLSLVTLARKVD
ncbi:MAG: class I SAM-dependent methyltransferase [Candidatus Sumerlaeia bacterium]|nr:class I SAM-dependent methyltransferase [Candidatus Sumerlaeia bacterium]